MVYRDFNVIRFSSERNKESRISGPMRRFSYIIDELELKDPLYKEVLTIGKGDRITIEWIVWTDS